MSNIQNFVIARLGENDLPDPVHRAYAGILALSDKVRSDGQTNDWLSWLTGPSATLKIGEYIFGADPTSDAARISDHLRATLAATWSEHPDYDPAWHDLAFPRPD